MLLSDRPNAEFWYLERHLVVVHWWKPIFKPFWIISYGTIFPSYWWIHCITPRFFFPVWITAIIMVFSKGSNGPEIFIFLGPDPNVVSARSDTDRFWSVYPCLQKRNQQHLMHEARDLIWSNRQIQFVQSEPFWKNYPFGCYRLFHVEYLTVQRSNVFLWRDLYMWEVLSDGVTLKGS